MAALTKEQNEHMKSSATELSDEDLQAISGGSTLPDKEMEKIQQEVMAWRQSPSYKRKKDDEEMLRKEAQLIAYLNGRLPDIASYITKHS